MRALDGDFHRLSTDDEAMRREISRDSEQLRRAQAASAMGGGVLCFASSCLLCMKNYERNIKLYRQAVVA